MSYILYSYFLTIQAVCSVFSHIHQLYFRYWSQRKNKHKMHCLNLNKKTTSYPTPARYEVFVEFQLFTYNALRVQGCQNALVTSFASSNSPLKRLLLGADQKRCDLHCFLYILSENKIPSSTSVLFCNLGDSMNVVM